MIRIIKRDKRIEAFDSQKIKRALLLAFNSVTPGKIPNVTPLIVSVMESMRGMPNDIVVGDLQDLIETTLMNAGHSEVAKSYILYRYEREKLKQRRRKPDPSALSDYIVAGKYARHSNGRREVWDEIVDRVASMHKRRWPSLHAEIDMCFEFARRKEILPSMRSAQFGGVAMEVNNARGYNCSFTLVDRLRVFQEVFWLLLSGCGVGYSVQWQHVEKLPPVKTIDRNVVCHHIIEDTIEGWADAVGALIDSFFVTGTWVEFAYHKLRNRGSLLQTSGGRAPGHLGLRYALEAIRDLLLLAQGRCLRPIECSDILCLEAEAVLSGGIRRSSLIGLFSIHDTEMLYSKAKGNYRPAYGSDPGLNAHRAMVNISAALLRGSTERGSFDRLLRVAEENYGDPGFVFLNDLDHGTNPCGEIGLNPVSPSGETGFAFCNLTSINVTSCVDEEQFLERCAAAAFIGTLQAAYTSFGYLGSATEAIAERDALLGVSLTGIQDSRWILDARVLEAGAARCVETNKEWAARIGISPAARVTCVKPEGTGALVVGSSSGIHHHWYKRYFKRVTANPNEPVAQYFRSLNPHMVEEKPNGDWAIVFPVEAPSYNRTTAMDFLQDVLLVYKHWVIPGTQRANLTHNVSCTVTLASGERSVVCEHIWENRQHLAALSFVPDTIDVRFPFAPWQAVLLPEDEAKWDNIIENYKPVDWRDFTEDSDGTSLRDTVACAGGVCEI